MARPVYVPVCAMLTILALSLLAPAPSRALQEEQQDEALAKLLPMALWAESETARATSSSCTWDSSGEMKPSWKRRS